MTNYKNLFSLPSDMHYLNCAYMSPLSKRVMQACSQALDILACPSRLTVEDFFQPATRIRHLFASLINAPKPEQIAIIPSVSYGMSIIARNTRLSSADEVVVVEEQFPSAVYTWRKTCTHSGATLRIVESPTTGHSRGNSWNKRLIDAIDVTTKIVVIPEFHWTDGLRFDLKMVRRRTKEVGARLVIDGTQSIGVQPFDVQDIQPDALLCAGYKWLTGPYGIGLAYFDEFLNDGEPLEENWITRLGSENFSSLTQYQDAYQPGAIRYDVGERSNFVMLPMLEAALTQITEWQPERIASHSGQLTQDAAVKIKDLGFEIEDEAWRARHILGIQLPQSVERQYLIKVLEKSRISASLRGDSLRISPHIYNDMDDIQALVEVLASRIG